MKIKFCISTKSPSVNLNKIPLQIEITFQKLPSKTNFSASSQFIRPKCDFFFFNWIFFRVISLHLCCVCHFLFIFLAFSLPIGFFTNKFYINIRRRILLLSIHHLSIFRYFFYIFIIVVVRLCCLQFEYFSFLANIQGILYLRHLPFFIEILVAKLF